MGKGWRDGPGGPWRRAWVLALAVGGCVAVLGVAGSVSAAGPLTITVNSSGDLPDLSPGDGACETDAENCTLRAAIEEANNHENVGAPDLIRFAIGEGGPQTITIDSSPLPEITDPVVVDGTTQPDYGSAPLVFIDGSSIGSSTCECSPSGLRVGANGSGSTIRGLAIGNFERAGVRVEGSTVVLRGNTIGYRKLAGGGGEAVGNGLRGIEVSGNGVVIGGSEAGDGNVVSGTLDGPGIFIGAVGATIQGNLVGTDAAGTGAIPNDGPGIVIEDYAGALIGGASADARNVISGNRGHGILLDPGYDAVIQGNYIGVAADGTTALGNGNPESEVKHDGIRLRSGDNSGLIGGLAAGEGNLIAHNTGNGIGFDGFGSTRFNGNAIHDNGLLGIDLDVDGVDPIDPGDGDDGANGKLNAPSLASATVSGAGLEVSGTLQVLPGTLDPPGPPFRVEVFASPDCDPSESGEGARFLGAFVVNATEQTEPFTRTIEGAGVTPGETVTATTTDDSNNTSEFSGCVTATGLATNPIVISPEADTFVSASAPTTNYGGFPYADTYGGFSLSCVPYDAPAYALMRFDLSAIPAGATIADVRLETTTRAGYAQDGDGNHHLVFLASDAWDEGTVTWATRPPDGTVAAGNPQLPSEQDIRSSPLALGSSFVWRAGCGVDPDPAGLQAHVFPTNGQDALKPLAAAKADFVARVTTERAGDRKLSLEIYNPNCPICPAGVDKAYWARYLTRESTDAALRPRLVVTLVSEVTSVAAALEADRTTLEAGASAVDVADLPLTALAPPSSSPVTQQPITQQPITQQPITQQPITQQPITQQPITQQPITQQPITQFGFGDLGSLLADPSSPLGLALGGVTLDTLPTTYPGGWPKILEGTPYATRPEQNVSLRQVLTSSPKPKPLDPTSGEPQLQIGQLDFLNSKLASLPLFALAFGSTPLLSLNPVNISVETGTTTLPGGEPVTQKTAVQDWEEILAGPPYNCATSCDLAGESVISAGLAGAPITQQPITQQPITQQPITQQPITQQPITQQPITQQPITQQPIAQMPIAQMPLQAPITQQPITQQPITQQQFTYFATSASPITQHPITQQGTATLPPQLGGLSLVDILASGRSAFPPNPCGAGGRLGAVSRLGTIPVAGLPTTIVLSGATGTLADAYCAAKIAPSATLQTLSSQRDLSGFTLGDIAWYGNLKVIDLLVALGSDVERYTFGDLVGLMINRLAIDWESLSPEALSEAGTNPEGTTTLHARFTLSGSEGASAAARVILTLPPYARRLAGGDVLTGGGVLGTPVETTIVDGGEKRTRLTWAIADVPLNVEQVLDVDVIAGFLLGAQQADLQVTDAIGTTSDTDLRPLTVVDVFGDRPGGPGNDTAAAATAVPVGGATTPGAQVYQSYISSAGDIDVFKVPNPGAGFRISAHLTNLPADYDLSLVGPDQPDLRTAPAGPPLQDPPVRDSGAAVENRNTSLEPAAVQDLPITQQPITQQSLDQSINRGTNSEDVAALGSATPGDFEFTIRVAGYNGASSGDPYSLRIEVTPEAPEPSCTPWPFSGQPGGFGSAPLSLPAGTNTLFLVNRQRLAQTYGEAQATNVMSALTTIAGATSLGVQGAVVAVDSYPTIRGLYDAWNANPCSATRSNAVSSAIASQIDALRGSSSSVKYVVLVGGFDQIPPFAVPDVTRIANESGFAASFADNQYFGWASTSKVLTDDPYYDTDPVDLTGSQVFVPDLVGGRLVEEPTQIVSQLQAFQTAGGTLNRSSAFVSGYEFVADSAQAVNSVFGTFQKPGGAGPLDVRAALINNSFTRNDLLAGLFPAAGAASLNVLNGHFDTYRTLTAGGSAAGTLDVVSTADIDARPNALNGDVLLTVGCHSGLAVSDVIVGTTSPLRRDWAQALAAQRAHWAANTGYGLGDTDTIAYSEQLVLDMARRLDGSVSIGEALTRAKADYYLQKGGNLSAYDRKSMAEMTLYGLPFYGVGVAPTAIPGAPAGLPAAGPVVGATAATTPASTAIVKDPASGVDSATFNVTPAFTLETTPNGGFYTNGGQVNTLNYRPIVPRVSMAATRNGLVPHSPFLESLQSTDNPGFNPVYQTPTVDLGALSPELTFGDAAFPSKLPSIVTTKVNGAYVSQLNLSTGQFFVPERDAGDPAPPPGVGVMRRFTQIAGRVFYAPAGTEFEPPTILRTTAVVGGPTVAFTVDVNDLSPVRVYVLFKDASGPQWRSAELSKNGTRWTGGSPVTGTQIEYIVQACDANGNCATSSNKAKYFKTTPPPAASGGLAVTLNGNATAPFTFTTSPVTAELIGAAPGVGVTHTVDGGAPQPGADVDVTGEGLHTVRFDTSDGSSVTRSFVIDTDPPVVVIQTPAPNGAQFSIDQPLNASFACLDSGSGIQSCTASVTPGAPSIVSGAPLPWTPGTHTLSVTATDLSGRTVTLNRIYQVIYPFTGFFQPVDNPPVVNSAKAGSAIPVKFSLGGNRGLAIFAAGYPKYQQVNCTSGGALDEVEETSTAGSSALQYDAATGLYTYVWKTLSSFKGKCYQLQVRLVDGTDHVAGFKFR